MSTSVKGNIKKGLPSPFKEQGGTYSKLMNEILPDGFLPWGIMKSFRSIEEKDESTSFIDIVPEGLEFICYLKLVQGDDLEYKLNINDNVALLEIPFNVDPNESLAAMYWVRDHLFHITISTMGFKKKHLSVYFTNGRWVLEEGTKEITYTTCYNFIAY